MKQKKLLLAALCSCLALSAVSGASYAYLTDSGTLTNSFTTGTIQINTTEPKWTVLPDGNHDQIPDQASNLVAGREITKDPSIQNASNMDVWCFLKVEIPTSDVMLTDTAPDITNDVELFTFKANSGWKLLSTKEAEDYVSYVYGYTSQVKAGMSTPSLFDSVTFADVVEGQVSADETLNIRVEGTGIQAQGFASIDDAYKAL